MRTKVFKITPKYNEIPITGKTTTGAFSVPAGEDLTAYPVPNLGDTHEGTPFFSFYISADKKGKLHAGNHVPATHSLLAHTTRIAEAEHLVDTIRATANKAPSGNFYAPMCTESPKQSDRDYFIALYAAKLHQETRSSRV